MGEEPVEVQLRQRIGRAGMDQAEVDLLDCLSCTRRTRYLYVRQTDSLRSRAAFLTQGLS